MVSEATLDIIIRFHDVDRLAELERAAFSITAQTYRPIRVIVVLQRFSDADATMVEQCLNRMRSIADDALDFRIVKWDEPEPPDARSALINCGMSHASGRYLAFLDYDDLIYPEAYDLLIRRLRASGACIAFGGIEISHADVYADFSQITKKTRPYVGNSAIDLLDANFCPIHSFVLDRSKISHQQLFFEPFMTRNEDYDFLIRICAQYRSDFKLVKTYIGTYIIKNDGSNTILSESAATPEHVAAWRSAEQFVEGRRVTTPVSADVQRMLGLRTIKTNLTVRGLLSQFGREPRTLASLADFGNLTSRSGSVSCEVTQPVADGAPVFAPPGHFYSPIPDPVKLRASTFDYRRANDTLAALYQDFDGMEGTFRVIVDRAADLAFPSRPDPEWRYYSDNDQFGIGDAIILSGMIRVCRPSRIMEVGSGFSSAVILDALDRTPGLLTECTFIEPYPDRLNSVLHAGDHDRVSVMVSEVQEVPLDVFAMLEEGDILFLDTTHVSKTGSDVNHELFQILPRLNSGVIIHFHDIFSDFEYPGAWIYEQNRAWNEQYLLRAFLMYNRDFEILFANHGFALARPECVRSQCPKIADAPGGGLWLRKRSGMLD